MKKLVVLAVALTYAGTASAGMWCKNDTGQSLQWNNGDPRPTGFNTNGFVICYVQRTTLALIQGSGLPMPPLVIQNQDGGVLFRGIHARWLVDNIAYMTGAPATLADYNAIVL